MLSESNHRYVVTFIQHYSITVMLFRLGQQLVYIGNNMLVINLCQSYPYSIVTCICV